MEDKRPYSEDAFCSRVCCLAIIPLLLLAFILIPSASRNLWGTVLGIALTFMGATFCCSYSSQKRSLLKGSAPEKPATPVEPRPKEIPASTLGTSEETAMGSLPPDGFIEASLRNLWYPEEIKSDEFIRRTVYLEHKTTAFRVDGVSTEQMWTRAVVALQRLSLHLVTNEIHTSEGQTWAKLAGWARSRLGRPYLGVELNVSGIAGSAKCLCRLVVHSDASDELEPVSDSIRTMLTYASTAEPKDLDSLPKRTQPAPSSTEHVPQPEVLIERQASLSDDMLVVTVRVSNKSSYLLRDVDAFLISYPSALLKLITDDSNSVQELEPGMHEESRFTLKPLSDSSRGEVIAAVSYLAPDGRSYTVAAEPLSLVPLRGMLEPDPIGKDEFDLRMTSFRIGETTFKADDWTPEEMYERSMQVLTRLGFHLVQNHTDTSEALMMGEVDGAARGKATHKPLVVTLVIYGTSHAPRTSCRIIAGGEDESMIFPSIEEIKSRLEAWPCPACKTELTAADIQKLKSGGIIRCSSCGKTMDLGRYRNWAR